MARYLIVYEGDDESGYTARCPDLPGLVVTGATCPEARQRLIEAMTDRLALTRATRAAAASGQ